MLRTIFVAGALTMTILASEASSSSQTHADANEPVIRTTVCELSRRPNNYYGKLVEVRARVRVGFEWSNLWDIHCNRDPIGFNVNPSKSDTAALEAAIKKEAWDYLVVATISGRLVAPTPYSNGRPVLVANSADKITSRHPPVCPWTIPPPPKRGQPISDRIKSMNSDPCNPDNWLHAHPSWSE